MSDLDPSVDPPPPAEYAYDPELPFLAQLEREIRREALRAAADRAVPVIERRGQRNAGQTRTHAPTANDASGHAGEGNARALARAAGTPARRRGGGAGGSAAPARIARRSLTLVALLCLIGASAYGARSMLGAGTSADPSPVAVSQGAFVLAAHGSAGPERWSLRLYRRGGNLCRVLVVAESEASRCTSPPGSSTLSVTSTVSPMRRYIFGLAGGETARVAIRAGGSSLTVPTHTLEPAQARAAGLPARTRYFVAIVTRPLGRRDPAALVQGLNATGQASGPAFVDCVQSAAPRPCPSK